MSGRADVGILERLSEGPVLGDGGYLLELEKRGWVRAGPFTPEVVLLRPSALHELHCEFREAGAEVLQALTFYASEDKLATVGLEDRLEELNRRAVRIARDAAEDRCLVAGNLSLTWMYDAEDDASHDHVRRLFDQQLELQLDEGVDLIVCETFSWLGEALLAAERATRTGLPVMVTMSFENPGVSSDGKTAADCALALVDAGVQIVGHNCLRNPDQTLPLLVEMREALGDAVNRDVFLAAQPTAYRTPDDRPDFTSTDAFPAGLDPFQLSRKEMADYAQRAHAEGIRFVGACCGAVATHVREMGRALGKVAADARPWRLDYDRPMSAFEYYEHSDDRL